MAYLQSRLSDSSHGLSYIPIKYVKATFIKRINVLFTKLNVAILYSISLIKIIYGRVHIKITERQFD